jgi:hypothetical protein
LFLKRAEQVGAPRAPSENPSAQRIPPYPCMQQLGRARSFWQGDSRRMSQAANARWRVLPRADRVSRGPRDRRATSRSRLCADRHGCVTHFEPPSTHLRAPGLPLRGFNETDSGSVVTRLCDYRGEA